MNQDVIEMGIFFFTVIVLALGVPLVRSYIRRKESEPRQVSPLSDARLERMEAAIDSMAVEIERISEGQRFVTKLLAERERSVIALPRDSHGSDV
jgi:hypothetical protein